MPQVLVVNHALFFSDLGLRRQGASILPDYDIVILDEAHTIEAVAGDHLGLSISSSQIDFQLTRLFNDRTNRGLLVYHKLSDAQREVQKCRGLTDEFFGSIDDWLALKAGSNGRVTQAEIVPNRLSPALLHLARMVRKAGSALNDEKEKHDFQSAHDRLTAMAERARSLAQAADGRLGLLGRTQRLAPRPATDRIGRRADRRRPDLARIAVRYDADRRAHQRHALGRPRRFVRLFQIAHRADAIGIDATWAARSIISARSN